MISKDKKKIAFITDTSCNLENGQYDDIYVIPLQIVISSNGEIKSFRDRADISIDELKKYFTKQSDIKTSQASIRDMMDLIETIYDDYDEIFVFPISRKLSGNHNSWAAIAEDYNKVKLFFLDDVGEGMGLSILQIREKIKNEVLEVKDIENYIETKLWPNRFGMLCVLDMKQLAKGGRVSNTKSIIAKILHIMPLITFDSNGLIFYNKTTNMKDFMKQTKKYVAKHFGDQKPSRTYLLTSSDKKDEVEKFVNAFEETFTNQKYQMSNLPGVIIAHTGPDYFAIYWDFN